MSQPATVGSAGAPTSHTWLLAWVEESRRPREFHDQLRRVESEVRHK
jgi:hypothetical protein